MGLVLSAEPSRMPTGFLGAEMNDWALGFFLTLTWKPACPGFAAYPVFHRKIQMRLVLTLRRDLRTPKFCWEQVWGLLL